MQKIAKNNYVILFGIIVLIITGCFAFYNIYNSYQNNKIKTSPLATKEYLFSDLKVATTEMDADTFLVISYVEDEKVYNNEKELKKLLRKNNLLENVIYVNVTDNMNDEGFLENLNSTLNLEGNFVIKNVPSIIYYHEGVAKKVISSKNGIVNKNDIAKLIDEYELAS